MIVLKFGGTSVGTVESLGHVKQIVEGLEGDAIVVVSALGGLTDKLIATAKMAADADAAYKDEMGKMAQRHYDIISRVVPAEKQAEVKAIIEPMLAELANLYDGVALINALPEKTLDQIVSFGERMSSVIVANMIEGARHFNSLDFIKTEKWFNKNIAATQLTNSLICSQFKDCGAKVAVAGGFIATDKDSGAITNLGRGGSDYTAALIAAALDAECLEIWTDVDGFMTADPRIIPQAKIIDSLSFIESMELCSFGAKVVYPPTIYPVFHKNIPIRILNTFRPQMPGTWITDRNTTETEPKGISSIRNVELISITGHRAENVPEINSRSFNALAKSGIGILLVAQPEEESVFSFAVAAADAEKAMKAMKSEFAPDLESGDILSIEQKPHKSIIAIVGENIGRLSGIGPRIQNSLERNHIIVEASSRGASASSQTFVVDADAAVDALKIIHEVFFE